MLWVLLGVGSGTAGTFVRVAHAQPQMERATAEAKRDAKAGYMQGRKALVAGADVIAPFLLEVSQERDNSLECKVP